MRKKTSGRINTEKQQDGKFYIVRPDARAFLLPRMTKSITLTLLILAALFAVRRIIVREADFVYILPFLRWAYFVPLLLLSADLLYREMLRRSTRLNLGLEFLVYKEGVFFTSETRVYYDDIRVAVVLRKFSDRFWRTGTIALATAGTGGYEVVAPGFAIPERITAFILDRDRRAQVSNRRNSGAGE